MTMTRPNLPVQPEPVRLPEHWPSAWPSLRGEVALSASFPVLTSVLTVAALIWLQLLGVAWWTPLVPLLLLPIALSRPGRVRRAVQRADTRRELRVSQAPDGLLVRLPRRSMRRRVHAHVFPDQTVVYSLRRG